MGNSSVHVLLIGGAGYIGSHMLLKLLEAGYETTVVDNLSTGFRDQVPPHVPFYNIDIGNHEALDALFREKKFDIVMHFAASIIIGESVKHPEKFYYNNFVATLNLLEVMRKNQVNKIIFSSTSAIFGEPQYLPLDENHAYNPINPYGRSKLMCEYAIRDYNSAYGFKSVCLRYFNASGADYLQRTGFDKKDMHHLIPVLLQVATGELSEVKIYGVDFDTSDGTGIRDYIHIFDLCDAHLLAMEHLLNGGDSRVYNLGNGQGYTVREVIRSVEKITGKTIKQVDSEKRPGDPEVLIADSKQICNELGWKPKYADLDTIVTHSWEWVKN
jgi:UDP-glucose 4-epimerase